MHAFNEIFRLIVALRDDKSPGLTISSIITILTVFIQLNTWNSKRVSHLTMAIIHSILLIRLEFFSLSDPETLANAKSKEGDDFSEIALSTNGISVSQIMLTMEHTAESIKVFKRKKTIRHYTVQEWFVLPGI